VPKAFRSIYSRRQRSWQSLVYVDITLHGGT
jgi:hypothetical protein